MLENELNKIWQNSTPVELVKFNTSKLLIDLDSNLRSFNKSIKNRDKREIIAAIIVMPIFGAMIYFIPQIFLKMGILRGVFYSAGLILGILYGILVIYKLKSVRRLKVDDHSLSMKEYITKQREYLVEERNLLDNVLYWGLLPPVLCVVLIFTGLNMGNAKTGIIVLICILFSAFAYYLNKKTVKKDFNPLIGKLDVTLKEFETEK
jgi:hypothetical protein